MSLPESLDPDVILGIQLFNEGKYFEAHEALELAWRREIGSIRNLYKGILQASVFYLHITRNNIPGAIKVFERSLHWLDPWPDITLGIHVGQLKNDLRNTAAELLSMDPAAGGVFDARQLKPIIYTLHNSSQTNTRNNEKRIRCDRCGAEMKNGNCKVTCPNCGNRFDCSDLNIYFDE